MTEQQIYEIFDQDGILCNGLKNYEFREGQLKMALDVLHCYQNNCVAAIEAGTGIGKSFAYLVPAIMLANEESNASAKKRTVVATSTINLQRQLMDKDIPTLLEILGVNCSVAFAVGRAHYICLRRLATEVDAIALYKDVSNSEIAQLNRFANESQTGLKEDFMGQIDSVTWSAVCSDSDFCIGGKCPYFKDCFYFKAKKKLAESSIIVCNHHLLFVDSHSRYEEGISYDDDAVLPGFNHLIIDEAHNIEGTATDLFTNSFSSYALMRQLSYIQDRKATRSTGYGKLLDDLLPFCTNRKLYEEILIAYDLLKERAETMNLIFTDILNSINSNTLLLDNTNAPKVFAKSGTVASDVVEAGQALIAKLADFYMKIKADNEAIEIKAEDLKVHVSRITDQISFLKGFISRKDWKEGICYLELTKHAKAKYVEFNEAPLEVASVLQEALFGPIRSVVCTSATLDLNDNFGYWCNNIGLPVANKEFLRKVYASPFDYKNRLLLLTPYDTPVFAKDKEDEYANFLISTIRPAIESSGGGALVLFTSFKLLESVYQTLSPMLARLGINSLKQGDYERHVILDRFKTDTDSVLFATDSFWEGVDAPGDTLRMVIITKLPFKMPDDPIFKARASMLESKGISSFMALSLPVATMKLKQGFGRLMRHTSDKGIVLILDSRIVNKGYGLSMLKALPESYHPETQIESIGTKIEGFLYG